MIRIISHSWYWAQFQCDQYVAEQLSVILILYYPVIMDFKHSKRGPMPCFPLSFFSSLLLLTVTMNVTQASSPCNSDSGPVKPTTPLVVFLQRVQQVALHTFGQSDFDPKFYVDLSLKSDLSDTEDAFDKLPKSENGSVSVKDLKEYIGKYFEDTGYDLLSVAPKDYVDEPEGFLPKVENPQVRAWALEVHSLWKNLSRKVSNEVRKHPEAHTLLPLPEQVMIPGSRFNEVYYWDSYWVIRLVFIMMLLFTFLFFFVFLCL